MKSKEKMEGILKECTFKPMRFTRKNPLSVSKNRTLTCGDSPPLRKDNKENLEVTPVKSIILINFLIFLLIL